VASKHVLILGAAGDDQVCDLTIVVVGESNQQIEMGFHVQTAVPPLIRKRLAFSLVLRSEAKKTKSSLFAGLFMGAAGFEPATSRV
jgi:hypothetical protein